MDWWTHELLMESGYEPPVHALIEYGLLLDGDTYTAEVLNIYLDEWAYGTRLEEWACDEFWYDWRNGHVKVRM